VGERDGAIEPHEGDILGRVFDLAGVSASSLVIPSTKHPKWILTRRSPRF